MPGRRWLNHQQLIDLAAHVLLITAWRMAGQVDTDPQAGLGRAQAGRPRGEGTFAPGRGWSTTAILAVRPPQHRSTPCALI